MPGLKQPPLSTLQQYGVNINNIKDVSYNPLYDYQEYAAAGHTTLTFFQVPIGQSGKTLADTNMDLAGQLSNGLNFVCTGVQVDFFPAAADLSTADETAQFAYDYYRVMTSAAYLQFDVLNKDIVQQGPLNKFPPAQKFDFDAAMATGNAVIHTASMLQTTGQLFEIIPVTLKPSQSFKVSIQFPTAVAVNTAGRIGVTLRGYRYRDAT